jgi:tripartite-type tricarboxylate transporter receptor subunit TctC
MSRGAAGLVVAALGLGAQIALATHAHADAVADFYRGKQVAVIIALPPGGGYDLNARALARHMGRYLPGQPAMVTKNMPGAASIRAANYLYNVAPKDGTEFAIFTRTVPIDPLLGGQGDQFDALKFNWIGSTSNEVSTCVAWHTAPVKTYQDLLNKELIVSASGAGSPSVVYPRVLNAALGTKFKVISGYAGSAEAVLALERGEAQGNCAWGWVPMIATKGDWLRDGKLNVIVQTGMKSYPGRENVPVALDMAKTDDDRRLMELVFAPQTFARPFAAPPDVPKDRVAALRKAFNDTTRDPRFLADAEKEQLEIELVTGEEIEAILRRLYQTPPAVIERARRAMEDPS